MQKRMDAWDGAGAAVYVRLGRAGLRSQPTHVTLCTLHCKGPMPLLRWYAPQAHRPHTSHHDLSPRAAQMPREELKPHPAPGAAAAPVAASAQLGASAAAAPVRRSLELYDGGVLVLTPLHLCMALGDGGRLAAHVLHTYPEVRAGAMPMAYAVPVDCTGRHSWRAWPAVAVASLCSLVVPDLSVA